MAESIDLPPGLMGNLDFVSPSVVIDIQLAQNAAKIKQLSGHPILRRWFLQALKLKRDLNYVDILRAYDTLTHDQAERLRRHWFPSPLPYNSASAVGRWPPGTFWTDQQPIVEIIRDGMIEAFELAVERELDVDYYWLMGNNRVTTHVWPHSKSIVLFQVTPPEPTIV